MSDTNTANSNAKSEITFYVEDTDTGTAPSVYYISRIAPGETTAERSTRRKGEASIVNGAGIHFALGSHAASTAAQRVRSVLAAVIRGLPTKYTDIVDYVVSEDAPPETAGKFLNILD
jgi:hypothetical protein